MQPAGNAALVNDSTAPEGGIRPPPRIRDRVRVIYRHRLPVRIMHWVNAICLLVPLGSGLQIFNAHAALYWGQKSSFDTPPLATGAQQTPNGPRGVTGLGGRAFGTTRLCG